MVSGERYNKPFATDSHMVTKYAMLEGYARS